MFTDNPFPLAQAESHHRGHATIEQVSADLIEDTLAHLPSAPFHANAAWLQLAVTAHALTRALGTVSSTRHAHIRGATIRTELICLAARPARSERDTITGHLPQAWPGKTPGPAPCQATHRGPPTQAA